MQVNWICQAFAHQAKCQRSICSILHYSAAYCREEKHMETDQLLEQPESKNLEFKRGLSSLNPILKTIVTFAK